MAAYHAASRALPDLPDDLTALGLLRDADLSRLAGLLTASRAEVAFRAQDLLRPVLAHDALVLVTPGSAEAPVQIGAPPGLRERLAEVDWSDLYDIEQRGDAVARHLVLPDVAGGLRIAGWTASAAGFETALLVGAAHALTIEPGQDRAALCVAMVAAARLRQIEPEPARGSLAFLRTVSQERERVRYDLRSRHAATLSGLLHALRLGARSDAGSATSRSLASAIDLASQALLDLRSAQERELTGTHEKAASIFDEVADDLRSICTAAGVQLVADLDAPSETLVHQTIAHAAQIATRAAVLAASEHAGVARIRVHWQVSDDTVELTVADDGSGFQAGSAQLARELADMRRLLSPLLGAVTLDSAQRWGTRLTASLPLYGGPPVPDTPETRRLAALGDRECEVLELMIAGLRNRDIAERLYITDRTVKFHVSNILRKLGVGSRAAAIALAHSAGISATPRSEPRTGTAGLNA